MAEVYIALGSNLGDRMAWFAKSRQRLKGLLQGFRMSSIYETDPVGYEQQPQFLNAVAAGNTDLTPRALLDALQHIEAEFGRERSFPNAPRTIDLDLLLYDDLVLDTHGLRLPHPRFHERFFVLVPLVELAPDIRHPQFSQTARELLQALGPPTGITRVASAEALDESTATS